MPGEPRRRSARLKGKECENEEVEKKEDGRETEEKMESARDTKTGKTAQAKKPPPIPVKRAPRRSVKQVAPVVEVEVALGKEAEPLPSVVTVSPSPKPVPTRRGTRRSAAASVEVVVEKPDPTDVTPPKRSRRMAKKEEEKVEVKEKEIEEETEEASEEKPDEVMETPEAEEGGGGWEESDEEKEGESVEKMEEAEKEREEETVETAEREDKEREEETGDKIEEAQKEKDESMETEEGEEMTETRIAKGESEEKEEDKTVRGDDGESVKEGEKKDAEKKNKTDLAGEDKLFGNSSDSEEEEKKEKKKEEEIKSPSRSKTGRPRRRAAVVKKKYTFKDEASSSEEDLSSAAEDSDESVYEEEREKRKRGKKKSSSEEEEEEEEGDGESMGEEEESEKKGKGKRGGGGGGQKRTQRKGSRPVTPVVRFRGDHNLKMKGEHRGRDSPIAGPSSSSTPSPLSFQPSPSAPGGDGQVRVIGGKLEQVRKETRGDRIMRALDNRVVDLAVGRLAEYTLEEMTQFADDWKREYKYRYKEVSVHTAEANAVKPKGDEGSSSSEDEWEAMELVEEEGKKVEVTVSHTAAPKDKEVDWVAKYLRTEVNRRIRETYECAHRMQIVAYIHHLQFHVKRALDESLVPSLALTTMPSGYAEVCGNPLSEKIATKFAKWIHDAFKIATSPIPTSKSNWDCRYDETARYAECMQRKQYETDMDRAMMYFLCFASLEVPTRLVCNCRVMTKKFEAESSKVSPKTAAKGKGKGAATTKKAKEGKSKDEEKKKVDRTPESRDYWIEYWCAGEKKWIAVDPLSGSLHSSQTMEERMSKPALYVFGCDDKLGIRDVCARYLSSFATPEFRRLRTDANWLTRVLRIKSLRSNSERCRLEDLSFHNDLAARALPKSLQDYKNHPLYVLEKDLLKFQGIYPPPEEQKPIGEIRGHKIYPRSTLYHLQGSLNWIKLARSVKESEEPYKVVKARPNGRVPVEKRGEPKDLPLYGFWQTEPYRVPKVENGIIPRNEFGNVYLYQESMVPIGTVHLRLNGIVNVCRRLNKEHVTAVTGWDFHGGCNHPVIEGACVLEEDVEEIVKEWEAAEKRRVEREEKKRTDRIATNWRKLIRGILRIHAMRKQFKTDKPEEGAEKKENKGKPGTSHLSDEPMDKEVAEENAAAWPQPQYTMDND